MAFWDLKPSRMRCVSAQACKRLLLPSHPPALFEVSLLQTSQQAFQLHLSLSPLLQVFERVARNVVAGTMEGYNGTVFAYGQTGSGKTFTITGGPERYVDRGIIPRSLSLVYNEVAKRSDYQFTVSMWQSVCQAAVLYSSTAGRSSCIRAVSPYHMRMSLDAHPACSAAGQAATLWSRGPAEQLQTCPEPAAYSFSSSVVNS